MEPMTVEENTKYCEPICRDWHGWNLPVMDPISPSKHGVVESRHRLYPHVKDFQMKDGEGGQWPVQEPPISGQKNHNHPGGISTPGEGGIDYWDLLQIRSKNTTTMAPPHTETLTALNDLQSQPLSIIRLSESISSTPNPAHENSNTNAHPRTSDISLDHEPSPTPASLAADASHYRDLFSKLRFSYLEQVTKEKFLRAIVGDPPLIVENAENIELESQLREIKVVLKEQKDMVARMVAELEGKGRQLARRYEGVREGMGVLEKLPEE
ncbi:MAG: hypothetical protein Q9179_006970, partial [Wetmoreana sp. 5 TL-2023]